MIFIGLGANLGDREQTILKAIKLLALDYSVTTIRISSFYETPPWGVTEPQPSYLNAVAELETELPPEILLSVLLEVEQKLGRVRSLKWEPRVIDLDLLAYHVRVMQTPALTLPHPFIPERRFVLEPWNEIAPDFLVPLQNLTVSELFTRLLANPQTQT